MTIPYAHLDTLSLSATSIAHFPLPPCGQIGGPTPLKLAGHPLLAAMKEVNAAATADDASVELDLSKVKLPAGTYSVYAESLAKVKYGAGAAAKKDLTASFYSSPNRLNVTPAPIAM